MEKLTGTIIRAIQDKKGKNIVSLDLSKIDAAGIEEQVLETLGEKVWRVEGQQNALWIAMDYVDVVVHIFQTELREFYKLEELWADAPATRYEYDE